MHATDIFNGKKETKRNNPKSTYLVRKKRGLLEKGSFQKSPFSRDSKDSRQPPQCGKQRRLRPENLEILVGVPQMGV